ncbi:MAG: PspC domain-containing protein [Clostridiales bacterium]|nr:PspC domain-containing protein [Clostridiales bacterium]MCD8108794.1 PspC domain-containing protein [Clostridiales bacterium]MCD8133066.1 PspC domain-containing protein [Clostridiales bacterium]
MKKRLYKSDENRVLCGVCGGVADFFGIDPTIVRLIWAIMIIFAGIGLWVYILAAIIIPRRPVD